MSKNLSYGLKALALSLLFTTVFTLGQKVAHADEVFIAGFTEGCFGVGCTPGGLTGKGGIYYSDATFSGTTANGFRALGGSPNPGANFNNLGSITLAASLPTTYETPFSLRVTFMAPQGFNGSNQATFTALITGTVRADNTGGVFVDFNNSPLQFTFSDPNCEPNPESQPPSAGQTTCGNGTFFFSVNDVSIDPGQTAALTGQITGAQQTGTVPEPASMLLLGTGLSGVAAAARRRCRQSRVES